MSEFSRADSRYEPRSERLKGDPAPTRALGSSKSRAPLNPSHVLALQRQVGNRAVGSLVRRRDDRDDPPSGQDRARTIQRDSATDITGKYARNDADPTNETRTGDTLWGFNSFPPTERPNARSEVSTTRSVTQPSIVQRAVHLSVGPAVDAGNFSRNPDDPIAAQISGGPGVNSGQPGAFYVLNGLSMDDMVDTMKSLGKERLSAVRRHLDAGDARAYNSPRLREALDRADPTSAGPVFTVISKEPLQVGIPAPWADEAIADALYGDPKHAVDHTSQYSAINVDMAALLPSRAQQFGVNSISAGTGAVIQISGTELLALGTVAELQRTMYGKGVDEIYKTAKGMMSEGKSAEEAARYVVNKRNELKLVIRNAGPAVFKRIAELRNNSKYKNALGPTYETLAAKSTDLEIIEGVVRTSGGFNKAGPALKILGASGTVLVSGILIDSPAGLAPLPQSSDTAVQAEAARLRLGIPPGVNIDRHGHLKPGFYLQVDTFDPHVGDELDSETEEILWWLGVDISYTYRGVRWTVPGR